MPANFFQCHEHENFIVKVPGFLTISSHGYVLIGVMEIIIYITHADTSFSVVMNISILPLGI